MDYANPAVVKQTIRNMIKVFVVLLILTVVTVAVSYLNVGVGMTIAIALFIAIIKGSLVAGYFMHLSDEKKIIYWVLIMSVIFFVVLMALPTLQYINDLDIGR